MWATAVRICCSMGTTMCKPVDPLDLWDNDPFDPQIEDTAKGRVIRGRGSSDDKGQLMTFIEALPGLEGDPWRLCPAA